MEKKKSYFGETFSSCAFFISSFPRSGGENERELWEGGRQHATGPRESRALPYAGQGKTEKKGRTNGTSAHASTLSLKIGTLNSFHENSLYKT